MLYCFFTVYTIKSERGDKLDNHFIESSLQNLGRGKLLSKLESLINRKKKMLRHLLIKKLEKIFYGPWFFINIKKCFNIFSVKYKKMLRKSG